MYRNMQYNNDQTAYKTLQEALSLIKQAVQGEKEDELFYNYLISVAPTKEEAEIISSIRDDEMKHNKMFREIYTYFTGEVLPKTEDISFEQPDSYVEGVKRALFGELKAVEKYRNILAGIPVNYYKEMVFEVLTDELKHADKYNYILNLQHEHMMENMQMDQMEKSNQNKPKEQKGPSNQKEQTERMGTMQTDMDKGNDETDEDENMDESYSPVQLINYINTMVNQALKEAKAGKDLEQLFRKYILVGVLIGGGYTLEESQQQVNNWDKAGMLKNKK